MNNDPIFKLFKNPENYIILKIYPITLKDCYSMLYLDMSKDGETNEYIISVECVEMLLSIYKYLIKLNDRCYYNFHLDRKYYNYVDPFYGLKGGIFDEAYLKFDKPELILDFGYNHIKEECNPKYCIPLTAEVLNIIFTNSEYKILEEELSTELKHIINFASSIPEGIRLLIEMK